jgi:hypothetical protein
LVKLGADGETRCTDVMEISRLDGIRDIANVGLTLAEEKRLLAGAQQEIVAAQVEDHAAQRLSCPRCGGVCWVKDYQQRLSAARGGHTVWLGHDATATTSLCRVRQDRGWHRVAIALPLDSGTGSASGTSFRAPDLLNSR